MLSKDQIKDDYFELINAIRHTEANDVKGLSIEADMSWPTVNQKVKVLNDEGYVLIGEQGDKRFSVNTKQGYFLGISVGVLDTKICLLDFSFKHVNISNSNDDNIKKFVEKIIDDLCILGIEKIDTVSESYLTFSRCNDYSCIYRVCTAIISSAIDDLDNNGYKLLSIGLSLPGIVDKDNDSLEFSPNFISLVGLKIGNIIGNSIQEELIKRDIFFHIYHDTLAATVYEKEYLYLSNNPNKCKKNIAVIYLEYGFGCSYIMQNRLLGTAAGEFGHINVFFDEEDIDDESKRGLISEKTSSYYVNDTSETEEQIIDVENLPLCSCGNKACLERLIRIHAFNSNDVDNYITKTTPDILSRYPEEHPYRYSKFKHLLSIVINTTVNLFTPDLIILSGTILKSIPKLREDLEFNMYNSALKPSSKYCSIINGTLKNDITAAGAAILSYYHKYSGDGELNVCWK